jgi:hypothetical protein
VERYEEKIITTQLIIAQLNWADMIILPVPENCKKLTIALKDWAIQIKAGSF